MKAVGRFKSRVQSWNGVQGKCVIICFYWSILIIHNNSLHYWLLAHVHNYFNHIFTSIFTTLSCPTSTPTGSLSHLRQLLTYTLTSFAMCVIQWEPEEEFTVPWVRGCVPECEHLHRGLLKTISPSHPSLTCLTLQERLTSTLSCDRTGTDGPSFVQKSWRYHKCCGFKSVITSSCLEVCTL